jgi:hypothetical protein
MEAGVLDRQQVGRLAEFTTLGLVGPGIRMSCFGHVGPFERSRAREKNTRMVKKHSIRAGKTGLGLLDFQRAD